MSNKTFLNVKVDKDLKARAQQLAKRLGLPLSTVVNAQLSQFVHDEEITFSTELRPTPYLKKILSQAAEDRVTGKNLSPAFENVDDLVEYLEKEIHDLSVDKKIQSTVG